MNISKYLSYKEVTKSYTATKKGISNIPSESQMKNIIEWARCIFDPVRSYIAAPLGCHTIYRSPELNEAIGGSKTSQHMANNGAAGDIDADIWGNASNEIVFSFIRRNLSFDQLIAEGLQDGRIQWVHCSYVSCEKNRNEVLLMYVENGETYYEHFTEERLQEILTKFKK
jgi:hypothetical protein